MKQDRQYAGLSPYELDRIADKLLNAYPVDAAPGRARTGILSLTVGAPPPRPQIQETTYRLPRDLAGLFCCDCGKPRSKFSAARCRKCYRDNAARKYYEAVSAIEQWSEHRGGFEGGETPVRIAIVVPDD